MSEEKGDLLRQRGALAWQIQGLHVTVISPADGQRVTGQVADPENLAGTLLAAICRAGIDAPEPAKVIIVAETPATGLDKQVDRHFPEARRWEEFDDGRLHVFDRKARRIATYAPGRWMSVREDDAILPDVDPSEADL